MRVYSPVDLREVGEVLETDPSEVESEVCSGRKVQEEWESTAIDERVACLQRLTRLIAQKSEDIAYTVHLETGKPKLEGLNTEAMAAAASSLHASRWLRRHRREERIHQGPMQAMLRYLGRTSYVAYRPLGVVGVIAPFNFPFSIPFTQTVAAVAAGNAVILKPSKETPMTGELVASLFREAGFPSGLVRCICGPGTGDALARSSVDKIVFTGSTEVGRQVMQSASTRLTPVILELGGKDAMLVLEDADLERASSAAVWGAFVNSGQVCVGIKRIYVQENVMDEFLRLMKDKTLALKQGDGWSDSDVSLGPLINQRALEDMERQVQQAVLQGGIVVTGGERNPDLKGYFFRPTIVTGLDQKADLVQQETFGPIVTVLPFQTEEEALLDVNDSPFALSGSVWTRDMRRGRRLAESFRSGTAVVNNAVYTYGLPATPWGGRGKSGFGRTHGEWGFQEMMETHHVHLDSGRMRNDFWWFPYHKRKEEAQMFFMRFFFQKEWKGAINGLRELRSILMDK